MNGWTWKESRAVRPAPLFLIWFKTIRYPADLESFILEITGPNRISVSVFVPRDCLLGIFRLHRIFGLIQCTEKRGWSIEMRGRIPKQKIHCLILLVGTADS